MNVQSVYRLSPLFFILLTASVLFQSVAFSLPARERKLYVGSDSTEAQLTFRHWVRMESSRKPSLKKSEEQIISQLTHMFGPMGEAAIRAVPRGDHQVQVVKVTAEGEGYFKIEYAYKGTLVLQNGPTSEYTFPLPVDPSAIYKAGMVGQKNPCTDDHYQDESDFWYFWNPENTSCPLKLGKDFIEVTGKIKRSPNTKISYPEYERLADAEGVIKISLLMGMDDPKKAKDPNKSADINAKNFRDIKRSLLERGYEARVWKAAEVKAVIGEKVKKAPYVEEFRKTFGDKEILMQVFFGPSGIDEDSAGFHYFFKDAIENSAIMMYDGHSGLGGHLDLAAIEESRSFTFEPQKDRYQIYFFNSCSSYTYYNSMFFDRKKSSADPQGTKGLDILTNGLATYFSVMHDTNMALVKAVEVWAEGRARASYQAISSEIDSGNLFGVNGDEDNP